MSWVRRRDLSLEFVLAITFVAGVARGQEVTVAYEVGDLLMHLSTVRGIDPQTGGAGALLSELLEQRFPGQRLILKKNVLCVNRVLGVADPVGAKLNAMRRSVLQTSKVRFEVAVARVPKAKFAELQRTERVQTLRDRAPLTALFRRVAALGGSLAIGDRDTVDMFGRVEMKLGGAKLAVDAMPDEFTDGDWTVALHCHRTVAVPAESQVPEPRRAEPDRGPVPTTPVRCCAQLRVGETRVHELPADPAVDFRELLIVTLSAHDPAPDLVPRAEAPVGGLIKLPIVFEVGLPPMPPKPAIR